MSKGVGVYIGRNEIIAVSVLLTAKGPQVKAYAVEPIAEESGEPVLGKEAHRLKKMSPEARAIRRALDKIREPGAFVTAAVSPFHIVTRHFIMPAVPKKEMNETIRFEASRYIPFKLSESVMDHSEQMTHKNVFSVTVTAMKQDILSQCLSDLRAASARVLMIEPAYAAVGRVFASLNMLQKSKTCCLVTLQSDGNVNLTFSMKGAVYLSRDFLLAGKPEEDKPRFFDEIKASLDYFYKLTGGEAVQQVFLSGFGDLKLWVEYLEHAFNYTVRFDLAVFPDEKDIPQDVMHSIVIAYGLALRSLGYKSPVGEVKLLPPEDRQLKPASFVAILAGGAAAIFLVFALIRLVVFQPLILQLNQQYEGIFSAGSGVDQSVVSQPVAALEEQWSALARKTSFLQRATDAKARMSTLLSAVGQGIPKSVWIDYISVEKSPGKETGAASQAARMNLRGVCFLGNAEKEAQTVNVWLKSLEGKKVFADAFSDVKLEEIKREKVMNRDVTRFRITAE